MPSRPSRASTRTPPRVKNTKGGNRKPSPSFKNSASSKAIDEVCLRYLASDQIVSFAHFRKRYSHVFGTRGEEKVQLIKKAQNRLLYYRKSPASQLVSLIRDLDADKTTQAITEDDISEASEDADDESLIAGTDEESQEESQGSFEVIDSRPETKKPTTNRSVAPPPAIHSADYSSPFNMSDRNMKAAPIRDYDLDLDFPETNPWNTIPIVVINNKDVEADEYHSYIFFEKWFADPRDKAPTVKVIPPSTIRVTQQVSRMQEDCTTTN